MSRPPLSARPQLETLEQRWNPAGTVRVSIDAAGNYLIAGDGWGNELRLENGNLTGENGTTVVGPADIDTSNKVTFRLAGGDDRLLIAGGMNFGKGLRVDLGSGSNAFELTGAGYTINGAFDIVQAAGPTSSETTSVKLASQPGDTFAILGPLTYTSAGRVDDTFEVGVGNANNAFVQGAITARLGGGENDADIRVLSAGGITIAESSVLGPAYSINLAVPTVRGDVVANLGSVSGDFTATHSTVQGRFAVTTAPGRSTVAVTAALGEVAESFTVRSGSAAFGMLATFTKIGTNLSVTASRQTSNIEVRGGEIGGSATVALRPSTVATIGGSGLSLLTVEATTVGGDLSVTNPGRGTVHTNVDVDKVGRDFRVTSSGIGSFFGSGKPTTTIDTDEVGRNAILGLALTGGVDVDLGTVGGLARINLSAAEKANVLAVALNSPAASAVTFTDVDNPTLQLQKVVGPLAVRLVRTQTGSLVLGDADQNVGVTVVVAGATSEMTIRNSNLDGDLNLTTTGDAARLIMENVSVAGDLVSRGLGRGFVHTISGGSIGGLASFTSGNWMGNLHRVQLDDVTVGSLSYVGGIGRNFLDLDTRAGLPGQVLITGTTRVFLGGDDDEVTFGGVTADPIPARDPQAHVVFQGDVFVVGGPGDDTLFNRNATFVPPAQLTTDSIDVV